MRSWKAMNSRRSSSLRAVWDSAAFTGPAPRLYASQAASAEGMRSTLVPVSKPRSKWAPRSSRTRSGLPHSKGEGGAGSGGGGMCGRTTASIAAKAPPGGHAVSPIRPPGRHRRASSAAAASGRRAKATPKVDAITSKAPEGRP